MNLMFSVKTGVIMDGSDVVLHVAGNQFWFENADYNLGDVMSAMRDIVKFHVLHNYTWDDELECYQIED